MKETAILPTISPKTGEPLCPEWAKRAAMPDGEFWDYVFHGPDEDLSWLPGFEPWGAMDDADLTIGVANPCPVCGSRYACGYDAEGRPFIHVEEIDHA